MGMKPYAGNISCSCTVVIAWNIPHYMQTVGHPFRFIFPDWSAIFVSYLVMIFNMTVIHNSSYHPRHSSRTSAEPLKPIVIQKHLSSWATDHVRISIPVDHGYVCFLSTLRIRFLLFILLPSIEMKVRVIQH